MAGFTETMTVTFVLERATITTTVEFPDVDVRGWIIDQAAETIAEEYGINCGDALDVTVANSHGDLVA